MQEKTRTITTKAAAVIMTKNINPRSVEVGVEIDSVCNLSVKVKKHKNVAIDRSKNTVYPVLGQIHFICI